THANLLDLSNNDPGFLLEITRLEDALFNLVSLRPAYFRPPFGDITEHQLSLLADLGYKAAVLWNVDTFDWQHPHLSEENVEDSLRGYEEAFGGGGASAEEDGEGEVGRGYISLQHDIQPVTADVEGGSDFIARAVDMVRSKGFTFVLVDECLGDKGGAYERGVLPTGTQALLSPIASSSPTPLNTECGKEYAVVAGDFCYAIAEREGLEWDQFLALNPEVVCDNLQIGQVVCVQVGASSQSGIITAAIEATPTTSASPASPSSSPSPTCAKQYTVNTDDFCFSIAESNGLSLDQFLTLNTGISCDSLEVGQAVCVEAGDSVSSLDDSKIDTSLTTTSNPTSTPPLSSCQKQHTVQLGDTCWTIAGSTSETFNAFLALNAGIQCDALAVGQIVCVE
ncbi:hypothetical protein HK102_000069, partial [Quaeritorhiza haematococci]